MKRMLAVTLILVFGALLSACSSTAAPTATAAPPPATAAPTAAPTLAPTDAPAATTAPAAAADTPAAAEGNAENGALLFVQNGCSGCHGAQAGGGGGPTLAGRSLEVEFVLGKVREGPGAMPEFSSDTVFDSDVYDIVAWLSTL